MKFVHPHKLLFLANAVPRAVPFLALVVLVSFSLFGLEVVLVMTAGLSMTFSWLKQIQIGRCYGRDEAYPYRSFVGAAIWGIAGVLILAWLGFDQTRVALAFLLLSLVFYFASHAYYGWKFRRS